MEDSFESRLNGDFKPAKDKAKGGKGWMVTSIILMILLVGAGVFAGIMTFSNNTNGDKMLSYEKQVSEKDTKIAELETTITAKESEIASLKSANVTPGTGSSTAEKQINLSDYAIEIKSLMDSFKGDDGKIQFVSPEKIEYTKDNKYLIFAGEFEEGMAMSYGVYYKEAGKNKTWKTLFRGHQFNCVNATSEQKEFSDKYSYMGEDLEYNYIKCNK